MNRNTQMIACKCRKTKQPYIMCAEEDDAHNWAVRRAFIPYGKVDGVSEQGTIKGRIYLASDYPGCPHCGNKSFSGCHKCHGLSCWDGETRTGLTCANCGTDIDLRQAVPVTELKTDKGQ